MRKELSGLQSTKTPVYDKDYLCNIQNNINRLKNQTTSKSLKEALKKRRLDIDEDVFSQPLVPDIKSNCVIYSLIEHSKKTMAYIDLTGRFHYKLSKGNQYILVGYHVDANNIQAVALRIREASSITTAWNTLHKKFSNAASTPTTYLSTMKRQHI